MQYRRRLVQALACTGLVRYAPISNIKRVNYIVDILFVDLRFVYLRKPSLYFPYLCI